MDFGQRRDEVRDCAVAPCRHKEVNELRCFPGLNLSSFSYGMTTKTSCTCTVHPGYCDSDIFHGTTLYPGLTVSINGTKAAAGKVGGGRINKLSVMTPTVRE